MRKFEQLSHEEVKILRDGVIDYLNDWDNYPMKDSEHGLIQQLRRELKEELELRG